MPMTTMRADLSFDLLDQIEHAPRKPPASERSFHASSVPFQDGEGPPREEELASSGAHELLESSDAARRPRSTSRCAVGVAAGRFVVAVFEQLLGGALGARPYLPTSAATSSRSTAPPSRSGSSTSVSFQTGCSARGGRAPGAGAAAEGRRSGRRCGPGRPRSETRPRAALPPG